MELLKGKTGNIEALIAKTNILLKDFSEKRESFKGSSLFSRDREHFLQVESFETAIHSHQR